MEVVKQKKNKIYAYLTAFIWPFLGLIFALVNYKASYSKNILWVFCAFFGYTFIVSSPGMDAYRYRAALERAYLERNEPLQKVLQAPFVDKGKKSTTDIYGHLITTLVSRFTSDFRIFFGLVGLIFGYFYSRNLFFIFEYMKNKNLIALSIILVIVIALIIPFWNINGYRFYTAAHVFVFGFLNGIYKKKKRYWLIALLSPLFHFSFLLPVFLLGVYFLLRKNLWIISGFLLISVTFLNLNPEVIYQNASFAPIFLQEKIEAYSSDFYIELIQNKETGLNWYVKGHLYALYFCLYSFILIALLKRKKWLSDPRLKELFTFGILLLAMSNIVSNIPSMGRFYSIAAILLCISFVLIIQAQTHLKIYRYLTYLFTIPLMLFMVVAVWIGFNMIGLNSLLLNPFIAPFFPDSPALIDFIK